MSGSDNVRGFFANLRQPGMPVHVWLARFTRNRFRAVVLLKGCCGNDGEPGC